MFVLTQPAYVRICIRNLHLKHKLAVIGMPSCNENNHQQINVYIDFNIRMTPTSIIIVCGSMRAQVHKCTLKPTILLLQPTLKSGLGVCESAP